MINDYFDQSGSRMLINLGFLAIILLADVAALVEKYMWEKQLKAEGGSGHDLEIKARSEPMLEMTTNSNTIN